MAARLCRAAPAALRRPAASFAAAGRGTAAGARTALPAPLTPLAPPHRRPAGSVRGRREGERRRGAAGWRGAGDGGGRRGCLPLAAGLSAQCAGRRGRRLSPPRLRRCVGARRRRHPRGPLCTYATSSPPAPPARQAGGAVPPGGRGWAGLGRAAPHGGADRAPPHRHRRGAQSRPRANGQASGRGRAASAEAPPRRREGGGRPEAASQGARPARPPRNHAARDGGGWWGCVTGAPPPSLIRGRPCPRPQRRAAPLPSPG